MSLESDEGIGFEEQTVQNPSAEFIPPSVTIPVSDATHTYCSPVPQQILDNPEEECLLGVDEAGRGPVLGPMVYGVSYSLKSFEKTLQKKYGFADSKTLSEDKRTNLLKAICDKDHDLYKNIGWCTTSLTARDISAGMLKSSSQGNYNLNEQAHDTTIDLIKRVLAMKVNLTEIYIDTVGPPATYQRKLQDIFPHLKVTVAKKADAIYPCVSTASVCAKVTRDISLAVSRTTEDPWGSGYPGDPKTVAWLKNNIDPVFGWGSMVRHSWQTTRDCLLKNGGVEFVWPDDVQKPEQFNDLFTKRADEITTQWYLVD
ncbi:unnamed protein product [Kuraishia capsulata CBS 1993]|uniref:Ribonuclease n=1 Tax=Kuraishia capsulata CBS 1993 TaxID=1382522 RepID=W6MRN8_9ASCO|nr:uncharacterized protein KUCA_T00005424001 [Kuraishia capsulata CBS 1993]CDK29436.1 unnamed protein product [Kuraishia capsulata CBS 1993]